MGKRAKLKAFGDLYDYEPLRELQKYEFPLPNVQPYGLMYVDQTVNVKVSRDEQETITEGKVNLHVKLNLHVERSSGSEQEINVF